MVIAHPEEETEPLGGLCGVWRGVECYHLFGAKALMVYPVVAVGTGVYVYLTMPLMPWAIVWTVFILLPWFSYIIQLEPPAWHTAVREAE